MGDTWHAIGKTVKGLINIVHISAITHTCTAALMYYYSCTLTLLSLTCIHHNDVKGIRRHVQPLNDCAKHYIQALISAPLSADHELYMHAHVIVHVAVTHSASCMQSCSKFLLYFSITTSPIHIFIIFYTALIQEYIKNKNNFPS